MLENMTWLKGAQSAPSAHNTQPWQFRILDGGDVLVLWSRARQLNASDPTNRDLYLALGACVESACLMSAQEGQPLIFEYAESTDNTIGVMKKSDREVTTQELELSKLLKKRQTGRIPHEKIAISATVLEQMHTQALDAGFRLFITQEHSDIAQLATLSQKATAAQFKDAAVHEELWQWLRLIPGDKAYLRDGLTADCLNLQGLVLGATRALLLPSRMRLLSKLGVHHLLSMDSEVLVKKTASMCLLTSPDLRRKTLIDGGRLLLRLWLMACQNELTTHPVSALLDCQATVRPTAQVFKASEQHLPIAIYRMGSTKSVPRAPRLPLEEFLLNHVD